jgi:hypothetical protein
MKPSLVGELMAGIGFVGFEEELKFVGYRVGFVFVEDDERCIKAGDAGVKDCFEAGDFVDGTDFIVGYVC